ncbi:MAG: hypothetical protein R6V77_04310 [Candidatus Cloacimonadaceae bacterium]
MRRKILVIITFILITSALLAQYDERAILTQQAQMLSMQRQYTEAEQAWLLLLQKYPSDLNAVAQLFQLYLQISKPDKAEKLLSDYRTVIPDTMWLEYDLQLDIHQAKMKEAWNKAQSYLQLFPKDENKYRLVAGYFDRKGFFEQAIRIYEQARTALNRNEHFSMEIGNAAFNSQLYDKALNEYIRFLESQPGNVYFVSNQVKNILADNPDLLSQLKNIAKNSSSLEVKEVYAIALSRMGRLSEALAEYEQLPTEKLSTFANEQFAAGQDAISITAFHTLRDRQIDLTTLGDVLLKTSEAHIRLRQFAEAESTLTNIVDPVSKKVNSRFERRRFPFQAYMILSDLAQWQNKSVDDVTELLQEARRLAINSDDAAEVDFRLIGIYYTAEQYESAEMLLEKQNQVRQQDRKLYYSYLIAMAKSEAMAADSLLNQLIIANPASPYVNDLMTMNILLMNLSPDAQKGFLQAYRNRLSHKDSLAIQTVFDLSNTAKDEELRILAADWAVASGLKQWALAILNYEWQDDLLREYSALRIVKLQTQSGTSESMAQDFLKSNPNSVFSPGFRQILQKAPQGRQSL